jgi:nucleoside-diphosphate-sugar epimerase
MAMPDAIKALLLLEAADCGSLKHLVYNVTSFNPTAEDISRIVKKAFPDAQINFNVHASRQGIVDSWPADVDDTAARQDWGWSPDYDQARAFNEYLIPAIQKRYSKPKVSLLPRLSRTF